MWQPQQPFIVEGDVTGSTNPEEVSRSTQYFDGLGRELQTVGWKISPNKKDIVSPVLYDPFGREQYKYLGYEATTNDGTFKTNPFVDQKTFYSTLYPTEQPALNGEQFYYSHTQFEASPLNRVTKTFAPGNSWAGSEGGYAEKLVSVQYFVNNTNDHVRMWDIGFDAFADNTNIPTSVAGREYDATTSAQLSKTVTIDEHNNAVVEYKDKEGQVVLKKVQIGAIASDYSGYSGFYNTFYVYDDLGQLRFVIPPKAVAQMTQAANWTLTPQIVSELCFRYEYDERQRMKAKKVPGADWVYMVYDKRDRLCFSQDGNLRSKQQWVYTLYDELNRPAETGVLKYTDTWENLRVAAAAASEASVPHAATGTYINTTPATLVVNQRISTLHLYTATQSIEFKEGFSSEVSADFIAQIAGATSATFSSTQTVNMVASLTGATWYPLTYIYYDNYGFGTTKSYSTTNNSQLSDGGGNTAATLEALPTVASTMTKGMTTGTRVRVIEDPNDLTLGKWMETVSYYDDKGRTVQVQADNYKGGREVVSTRYNFTDKAVATYLLHTNPATGKDDAGSLGAKTSFLYDHAGRVTNIIKRVDYNGASNTRTIAQNFYDALGQLKNKKIGQKSATDVTEMEDDRYSYNIRGWLKGVNFYNGTSYSVQESTAINKWFAFDLSYDWGMTSGLQYNGNIAGMRWKSAGDNKERAYGYSYDQANRLMKADFTQNNGIWGADAMLNFDVKMGDGSSASSAYDENGNIKKMQQWGLKGTASTQIDNLTYKYNETGELGNKLLGVKEDNLGSADNSLGDFTDKNPGNTDDYTYDVNGNLTKDKNKFIQSIVYNHLNLPYQITLNTDNSGGMVKGTITYIYDALGNKLEKRTDEKPITANNNTAKQTQTTYLGGFVYENNVLQFLAHEEGRIRPIIPTTANGNQSFAFDYFLKDHLGNVRMVLSDEVRQDVYPAASLEDGGAAVEKNYYDIQDGNIVNKASYPAFTAAAGSNYANNNGSPPYNNNPSLNVSAESQKLYRLNGAGGVKFGLGTTLKVMAGDNVSIFGKSFYHLNNGQSASNSYPVSSSLLSLLTSFTGGSAVSGHGVTGTSLNGSTSTTGPLPGLLNGTPPSSVTSSAPKAGINWILFDEQFRPVSVGLDAVDGAETIKTHQRNAPVTQNGYLYVLQ